MGGIIEDKKPKKIMYVQRTNYFKMINDKVLKSFAAIIKFHLNVRRGTSCFLHKRFR